MKPKLLALFFVFSVCSGKIHSEDVAEVNYSCSYAWGEAFSEQVFLAQSAEGDWFKRLRNSGEKELDVLVDGSELLVLQEPLAGYGDGYSAKYGAWVTLVTYAIHKPTMRFTKHSNILATYHNPRGLQAINDGFDPTKGDLSNERYYGRCAFMPM